jgi:hypothetical protein
VGSSRSNIPRRSSTYETPGATPIIIVVGWLALGLAALRFANLPPGRVLKVLAAFTIGERKSRHGSWQYRT